MRRPLAAVLGVAGVVVVLGAGALAALAFTGPGRRLLHGVVLRELGKAVDGTVRLGAVRLVSWHSVEVQDIALDDREGRPVLAAARVRATVRLLALLRGRFLIRDVWISRPVITLRQDSTGRWNVERLFRTAAPGAAPRRPRPLVDIRDARITDGTVNISPYRSARPLRFEGLDLDLRRLRVSDPDSSAVIVEVRNIAGRSRDPAVRVKRGYGHIVVDGDSVSGQLDALELTGSLLNVRGVVRTRGPQLVFDVTATADRFRFEDVAWIAPQLPRTGGGALILHASRGADGVGVWEFRGADLWSGTSRVRGWLRFATGGPGGARVEAMDLTAAPLDLALLAPLVRALPLHGEVRGQVRGAGPMAALDVVADLAFTDAAAPGRPVSTVAGRGRLGLGGAATVTFHHFALAPADVSLATVAGVAPAVNLHGRVRAAGTLDGPWTDVTFEGAFIHSDGDGPTSSARGRVRLTLADTVRLDADLAADSVSFDDLARTYAGLPLHGSVAGHVRVVGPVTALAVDADLAGPAGRIVFGGTVGAQDSAALVRLSGRFEGVDLAAHFEWAPPTVLAGSFATDLRVPTGEDAAPVVGTVQVTLDSSRAAGVAVTRAGLSLSLVADAIHLDTLFVEHPSGRLDGAGALGRPGAPPGQIHLVASLDTLAAFAPVVRWLRARSGDSTAAPVDLDGAGRLDARLAGTTASWEMQGDLDVARVAFGTSGARALHAEGAYASDAGAVRVRVQARADSLALSGMRFGAVRVTAAGPLDSISARVEASLPSDAALWVSGVVAREAAGTRVALDSAVLRLPSGAWTLAGAARVLVTADSIAVDSLDLRSSAGGRLRAEGSVPIGGTGALHVEADSVPLTDLFALAQRDTAGVSGLLSVSAQLSGSASAPMIEASLTLADGRFGDFRTPLLDALLRYADHLLTFKGNLWRDTVKVLGAQGSLPLDLALASVERRQLPGPLEIRVQADSADLSAMNVFTTLVRDVSGQLTAHFGVQGSWDQPVLTGDLRVSGAALTIPALGQRWQDIGVHLESQGNRIHVAEARIGGGGGTLDVRGDVVLQDLTRPVLDLTLDARGFQALNRRDFAGLTGTGTLQLTGPFYGARLTGQLTVDDGYLHFADLVEKRLVNLDDPEFRAVVDSNIAQAAELGPAADVVFLDSLRIDGLRVAMGSSVWLRSTEANIQLAGDVTVSKTIGALNPYRLDGTLRAVRGTYRLTVGPTSKEFEVTHGEVRFFGTPDLNPQLDVVAEHTVRAVRGNDLVVRARLSGTLLEPILSLESDERPPLSETEIVSYLIFGRPSFELAGAGGGVRSEQAVLQGAVAGVAGIAASQLEQTLVTDLRLPLDYIAIRPGMVGDVLGTTRVEAGRQIGERTFLSLNVPLCEVRRGLSSQLFGATLAYRLSGLWRLEASVEPLQQECRALGMAPQPSTPYQIGVDLFWQRGIQ
jgi:translocation and assembly module TamB